MNEENNKKVVTVEHAIRSINTFGGAFIHEWTDKQKEYWRSRVRENLGFNVRDIFASEITPESYDGPRLPLNHFDEMAMFETPNNKNMQELQLNLAEGMKVKPALCLDLDGTVRRSKSGQSFVKNTDDIELMPGIEKLIWIYRNMGWLIVGISNQGGVAHGFKLPMDIERELEYTFSLFKRNPFHVVKMCYHMADGKIEPYNHRSLLRKPDIGMLAIAEFEAFNFGVVVDWDKSLFVGDRPEDELCAKNAGIKFEHIDSFLVSPKEFTV